MRSTLTVTTLILALAALLTTVTRAGAQVWQPGNELLVAYSPRHSGDHFGATVLAADLDGDGLDDLAVGRPDANSGAGEVLIFLARPGRTFAQPAVFPGGPGACHTGTALAAGYFDWNGLPPGAGFTPRRALVISSPDCGHGVVTVLKLGTGSVDIHQDDISNNPGEDGDRFGAALAVGDFNGDGYDDLAIGVPGESFPSIGSNAGLVHTVFGGVNGLDVTTGATYGANSFVTLSAAAGDHFGAALAAGDFNGDNRTDLAIGIPVRTVAGVTEAGAVQIGYGSSGGIGSTGEQLLDEGSFGGVRQSFAHFGAVLAAGNFDWAGGSCGLASWCADDLAIGVPDRDVDGAGEAGEVVMAYGGSAIDTAGAQFLRQSGAGAGTGDHFGAALAAGRQDSRDRFDFQRYAVDLAVGAPYVDSPPGADVGQARLFMGSPAKLAFANSQSLYETVGLLSYPTNSGADFGSALAIGDFDGDGIGDLAIGIPGAAVEGTTAAGEVQILFGALFADGLEAGNTGYWFRSP